MNKTVVLSTGIVIGGALVAFLLTQYPLHSWRGMGMQAPHTEQGMVMMHGDERIDNERAFIEHMVPHHEEAIATAGEVLERGGTTQGMIDLANNIITSQTVEVALMKEKYEEWFGEPYQDKGTYDPMMRELAPYSGVELDSIFLHDMSMHHMGAIMVSRNVQPYLEHDVMKELTSSIIVNQTREIELMQRLHGELER